MFHRTWSLEGPCCQLNAFPTVSDERTRRIAPHSWHSKFSTTYWGGGGGELSRQLSRLLLFVGKKNVPKLVKNVFETTSIIFLRSGN